MIDLNALLDDKIHNLDKHLQIAIYERDHSDTPMESHYDKARQIAEQMIDSLSDERNKLLKIKTTIKNTHPEYFTLSSPLGERRLALVPEGLGGQTVEGITLITKETPLGSLLVTAKVGDEITLNGQTLTVIARP